MKADDILQEGRKLLVQRGVQRDQPEGERSMPAVIAAFNALTNHQLTEQQGWLLMALVKIKRSQTGTPDPDHYIDGANYVALAGEAALAAGDPTAVVRDQCRMLKDLEESEQMLARATVIVAAVEDRRSSLSADGTLASHTGTHNIADIPEGVCPICAGTGRACDDGDDLCPTCGGTGAD